MKLLKPSLQVGESGDQWSTCIIDFPTTPVLGETIPEIDFQDTIYHGVTPMTAVFGSETAFVCWVQQVTPVTKSA